MFSAFEYEERKGNQRVCEGDKWHTSAWSDKIEPGGLASSAERNEKQEYQHR